jgi:hypothetical protein
MDPIPLPPSVFLATGGHLADAVSQQHLESEPPIEKRSLHTPPSGPAAQRQVRATVQKKALGAGLDKKNRDANF